MALRVPIGGSSFACHRSALTGEADNPSSSNGAADVPDDASPLNSLRDRGDLGGIGLLSGQRAVLEALVGDCSPPAAQIPVRSVDLQRLVDLDKAERVARHADDTHADRALRAAKISAVELLLGRPCPRAGYTRR